MNAPLPDFKAIADAMILKGSYVVPVPTGTKACLLAGWQDKATRDQSVVDAWSAESPNFNVAVVAKPDGLWFFDDDEGVLEEYEAAYGKINTYRVASVSGGLHLYFKQSDDSCEMGNRSGKNAQGQESWSARVSNRYVIAAGSVAHPDNDTSKPLAQYRAIEKVPIIEAPASFIAFLKERSKDGNGTNAANATADNDVAEVLEGGRNDYLTSYAGTLRGAGSDREEIESALLLRNERVCKPPLDESEVLTIAGSISRKPQGTINPVLIGGRLVGVDAPVSESAAREKKSDDVLWHENFKAIKELEDGDVRMLIDGFLPEGTTFIGALPGEGKTLLALSIAKALTTGEDFLGRFEVERTVPVIYMIPESSARAFRKRCEKFHIRSDRSLFLCRTISEGTTLRLDDPILLEAVRTMKPVVILDTVIRFSDSDDENAATENKQLADDIIRLRQTGAVGVIGIHHATKAMREKGMTLETVLRGTGDLAACADAVYGMLRDASLYNHGLGPNEIDVECVKPRDFDPPLPFRIAASRKTESSGVGQARGIESVIDKNWDFLVVSQTAAQVNRDAELIRMVSQDPAITLQELEKVTGQGTWVIRQALKRLGWVKQKGGTKGLHRWVNDPSVQQSAA